MLTKRKNWTIFFGILTALVVVFSQIFWFEAADFEKKTAETQQTTGTADDTEAHITLPSTSLPTTQNIEVEQEFSFLHEILFEEKQETESDQKLTLTVGKFFHRLFRAVISPNAP